jgi:predicted dehydrogenase
VNYAVIGTGYWGTNHVRVAAELLDAGELDSLVLCDIDGDRVAEIAGNYGVESTTDYGSLPEMGVDAAVVASPSSTHREVATDLLTAGVDVLVEKPLALSSEDAWDIVGTAGSCGRTLGVGHVFRYHPALRDLKRRIDRGELGRITYLSTNRYAFRAPRADTGVLYSLAVHDVDIYSYLLDAWPTSLYCRLDSTVREGIDETATLTLSYGDVTGVINESWNVPVFGKRRDLTVVGTERSAYVDYLEDTTVELHDAAMVRENGEIRARSEGKTVHEADPKEPLRAEVEAFIEACRTGEEPSASGQVGARTIELLEEAERSAATGESVTPERP